MGRLAHGDLLDDLFRGQVENGDFSGEAGGEPEFFFVGGEFHAIGAAGGSVPVDHGERILVDFGDDGVDPIRLIDVAAIAGGDEVVGTFPGDDFLDLFAGAPVDDFDVVSTHDADKEVFVVRGHPDAGGESSDGHTPGLLLRFEINRHQFVRVLEGDEDEGRGLVISEMAGGFGGGKTFKEFEIGAGINVDAMEAERAGDEVFAVGAVADLVGIGDVADAFFDFAGVAVEEDEFVGGGIRNDQEFVVRGGEEVVGFFADAKALGLFAGVLVD